MNEQQKSRYQALCAKFYAEEMLLEEGEELAKLSQLAAQEDIARFGGGVEWLTKALYRYDFVSLVACGVPKDEYEFEARHILKKLAEGGGGDSLMVAKLVREEFALQFGNVLTDDLNRYMGLADELLANKQYWQGK